MSVGVVIPAAGQGKRMNCIINKQYLTLLDRPILAHTLALFTDHPEIQEIVVVVREEEMNYCRANVLNKYFNRSIKLIAGGRTRRESVYAGLKAFSPAIDYVIIHDGARPLLPVKIIDEVIREVKEYKAVTTGVRLKDTIKRVTDDSFVIATPPRKEFMAIHTPQAFLYSIILKAHQNIPDDFMVTDDASLVEELGIPVKVINSSEENIKVTTPLDMVVAENILKNRG